MLSQIGQSIGMEKLILESKYLQEHIPIRLKLMVIQTLEKW